MAKKVAEKKKDRLPWIIGIAALFSLAAWWGWEQESRIREFKDHVFQYVSNGDILTLETKLTPESVMLAHRQDLLGNEKKSFQDPFIAYYPYLLLNVKYIEDQKPKEGLLLWGYNNGEIVLNTDTWDTTHGFKDCLECQANQNDFLIIQALMKRGGALSIEELQKELKMDTESVAPWIKDAKQKHLIVQKGQELQLHFENPRFLITPQTRLKQQLVSKPVSSEQKISKTYSRNQIIALAKAAFGNTFKIQQEQDIFLPVFKVQVVNPDGSTLTSEWNAITGQRFGKQPLRRL